MVEPARAVIAVRVGDEVRLDRGRALLCELLAALVEAQGAVVSPEALFRRVWGGPEYHALRHRNTLYVALRRLRQSLRDLCGDDGEDRRDRAPAAGGSRTSVDAAVIRPADAD